jgi:hypothetical protein
MTGIAFANVGGRVSTTNCVAYCDKNGYSMAGTEFGGQCFCANKLNVATLLTDDQCDMKCEGDATENCGGPLALTVYRKTGGARRRSGIDAHSARRRHMHVPRSFQA